MWLKFLAKRNNEMSKMLLSISNLRPSDYRSIALTHCHEASLSNKRIVLHNHYYWIYVLGYKFVFKNHVTYSRNWYMASGVMSGIVTVFPDSAKLPQNILWKTELLLANMNLWHFISFLASPIDNVISDSSPLSNNLRFEILKGSEDISANAHTRFEYFFLKANEFVKMFMFQMKI